MLDLITQEQLWKILLDIAEKNNLGMAVSTHNKELALRVCTRIVDLTKL